VRALSRHENARRNLLLEKQGGLEDWSSEKNKNLQFPGEGGSPNSGPGNVKIFSWVKKNAQEKK